MVLVIAFVHYMLYMTVFIFTFELSNSTLESESLK